jgi:hypothetical protein
VSVSVHARRFALLLVALSTLSVTLVACQVSGSSGGSGTDTGSTLTFQTPNAGKISPTPTFPLFTIGAWPSNYSPQALDNITIYVLCRVQSPSMTGPATAPSTVTVTVLVDAPINKTLTGTTDANGMAAIPLSFTDPNPGTPVQVTVYTTWNGVTYRNATFFTPGATYTPTPKPTATGNPGATPSATP